MDWVAFAKNDWEFYHDPSRIHKYVEFGKITETQYTEITEESYIA